MRCYQCGAISSALAIQNVLRVAAPFVQKKVNAGRVHKVSELVRAYGLVDGIPVRKMCGSRICGGTDQQHRTQYHVASVPNVLLIQVQRFRHGRKSHVRVSPDLALQIVGFEEGLELSGVVYHLGDTLLSGHYVAVNVDDEGRFWKYDDANVVPLELPVEEFQLHEVYMLVYTRKRGFWRYGPEAPREAAVEGSDAEPSVASVEGPDAVEYAEEVRLESPPARSPPKKKSRGAAEEVMPDVPSVEDFPGQGADSVVGRAGGDQSRRSLRRTSSCIWDHKALAARIPVHVGQSAAAVQKAVALLGEDVGGQSARSLRRTTSFVVGDEALAARIPAHVGQSGAAMQKAEEELAEEMAALSLAADRSISLPCGALVGQESVVVSRLWLVFTNSLFDEISSF